MSITYHIRIKKEYAASVIEDLQKMDAVEIIKETDKEIVQDWQKTEVEQRIEKYRNNPELLIDEQEVFKMLDAD
ncbi:addiction module protein [Dyadobacter sp. BHUBP1]|uniref:addiction module protein n=1 Tax=Dyadobacter sp. BHUBP1 TaxID=3424178 RepID=UPI003D32C8F2